MMKTTLDLPRPLLLRIASRAARLQLSISRYVALTLEKGHPEELNPSGNHRTPSEDELFDQLRDELGL